MKALVLTTALVVALGAPAFANCSKGSCNKTTTITSHSNDGNSYSSTHVTVTKTSDSYDTVNLPKLKDLVGTIHGSNDTVTLEIVE